MYFLDVGEVKTARALKLLLSSGCPWTGLFVDIAMSFS